MQSALHCKLRYALQYVTLCSSSVSHGLYCNWVANNISLIQIFDTCCMDVVFADIVIALFDNKRLDTVSSRV